ncbi:MAG: ATP-binding protein [Polyangiaceae bacterium]|nr:ATP-binding protein [Polyangiaceae bacterium]
MAPYRTREEQKAPKEAPTTGLVADMVRQFADTFAFIRELVQNGIDAGATSIEVTVDRTGDVATVRVADNGCGMTLEVIENALLVLFRSTKDEDSTKIGKYGVGFMSVLAVQPFVVTIDTWRDGKAFVVRLYPDHTYEIEHGLPRDGHGTTVGVSKQITDESFEKFWQDATGSLHRWCRHAEVPITFTLIDGVSPEPRRARVDSPLKVRAALMVHSEYSDGMSIVVGPIAGSAKLPETGTLEDEPAPFAGFYNRGLTLHETIAPLHDGLASVRIKVKSSALCHTLSRDDVRRDNAFHLALSRAATLVTNDLRAAAIERVREQAQLVANGSDTPQLMAVLEVAMAPPCRLHPLEMEVPLTNPISRQYTMKLAAAQKQASNLLNFDKPAVLFSWKQTEQTAALAARNIPVVWVRELILKTMIDSFREQVPAADVETEVHIAREIAGKERLPNDDTLCTHLCEALASAGYERVLLARFLTAGPPLGMVVSAETGDGEFLAVASHAHIARKKLPKSPLLLLNIRAEAVDHARRANSPIVAADLLARVVLLAGQGITSKVSEALAVRALEQIQ